MNGPMVKKQSVTGLMWGYSFNFRFSELMRFNLRVDVLEATILGRNQWFSYLGDKSKGLVGQVDFGQWNGLGKKIIEP